MRHIRQRELHSRHPWPSITRRDNNAEVEEQSIEEWPVSDPQTTETPNAVSKSNEVRILVSSRHLCLASPVFTAFLSSVWAKSEDPQSRLTIKESNWDIDALLIVLRAMHGRHDSIRRTVNLETLAKIAAIVDYFDCREPIQLFAECWISALDQYLPASFGKDAMLWWSMSWVFEQMMCST
jgi:hypothetical protein